MNDKKLIRRALLGDKEAQKGCTEKGLTLPCPICGKDDCIKVMDCYTVQGDTCECTSYKKNAFTCVCDYLRGGCGTQIGVSKTKFEALKKWNTRTAPPVGRCGKCKYFYDHNSEIGCTNPLGMYQTEITEIDYCSYFEAKEESR